MRLTTRRLVVLAVGVLVLGACLPPPKAVSANPADFTPQLPVAAGTATYAFAQVGDTMYVGGAFAQIGGVARTNLAAFSATTGAMAPFAPAVDGQVWAIVATSDGQLVIGGTFSTVNGVARRGLAKLSIDGVVDPTFNANLTSSVFDAELVNGRLVASGTFAKRLAAFDPTTGADTGYIDLAISGTLGSAAGSTKVYRFAVRPQGDRLIGIGNFTSVGGQRRYRAFMLDLGATSATVSPWYYLPLEKECVVGGLIDYMRDVDYSPDGSWFAFATTGFVPLPGDEGLTLCDAAARFETANLAPTAPTWINYTGGDTLHSVAITDAAVYVGGHQRWLDNPQGYDTCGPGCVPRPGIGAIDPATGKATTWNPMRSRGIGAQVLYLTAAGLWVGSDTGSGGKLGCASPGGPNLDDCTGKALEDHAGIGFMPST